MYFVIISRIQRPLRPASVFSMWCDVMYLMHSKTWYVSYLHSVVTINPSCVIFEIKRDIGRKSRFVHRLHTLLQSTPRGSCRQIAIPFGMGKPEWCGYPKIKEVWRHVYSCFDTIAACDAQTERQTDAWTGHIFYCFRDTATKTRQIAVVTEPSLIEARPSFAWRSFQFVTLLKQNVLRACCRLAWTGGF